MSTEESLCILESRLLDPGTWVGWALLLSANLLVWSHKTRELGMVLAILAWQGFLFREVRDLSTPLFGGG